MNDGKRAPGLFASLTPEQQEAALAYDGPVGFGRSDLPVMKRRGTKESGCRGDGLPAACMSPRSIIKTGI